MDQHNNKNSIDEIDQRIIEALQMDGRRPFTKIAADLGISEASVRQRVANLINNQVTHNQDATRAKASDGVLECSDDFTFGGH